MEFLELRFHRRSLLNYNRLKPAWVNDRPAGGSQRFNSEPRQRNAGLQSLTPAGARVGGPAVVTEDGRTFLYRSGTSNTRGRQKSLPARKPTVSDQSLDVRRTNSASDKEKIQNYRNARQTVSIYLASPGAKEYELGPETKQVIHGIRTRSHEENYIRSTKFASSWAKVRAENLALRDGSPSEMSPTHMSRDGSHDSPRRDGSPSKYTDVSGSSGGHTQHQRFVLTKPRGRPTYRKQVKPKSRRAPDAGDSGEVNKTESPRRASWDGSRNTGSPSFGSERDDTNGNEGMEEVRLVKRRPAWNNNVNVFSHSLPKANLKKYENGLTFKPAITTKEEVYMAYTGTDKLGAPDAAVESDGDIYSSFSEGEDSNGSRSSSGSPGRSKERMLTKREAKAYIKMTAVYGSDAFKNQRKQWFMEKLALAQDQKAKLEEQRRKAEEKKREEDRKKQQRQLNYVRNKFRKQQVHRFQTQYVTSRVLEHEQANRHEYGLPEDFDDGTQPDRGDASPGSRDGPSIQSGENIEEKSSQPEIFMNGHGDGHKGNQPKVSQNRNGLQHNKSKENRRGIKDTTSSRGQIEADKRNKQIQDAKEEERQRQRQEQQKSWYAAYERTPRTEANKPQVNNRDSNRKPVSQNGLGKSAHTKDNGAKAPPNMDRKLGGRATGGAGNEGEHGSKDINDDRIGDPSKAGDKNKKSSALEENNSKSSTEKVGNGGIRGKGTMSNNSGGVRGQGVDTDQSDKKVFKKDTGPSLPHTKSHADTDNSNEKKGKAPYVFTGHFRQEADGTYHKLDPSETILNHSDTTTIANNDNSDKTEPSQLSSSTTAPQTTNPRETNNKNIDTNKDSSKGTGSFEEKVVQNLVNKSKVGNQAGLNGRHGSKPTNLQQNSKQSHNSRNKYQSSTNAHPSSKKSADPPPAKPSVTALLSLLEDSRSPERKPNAQTTSSSPPSSVSPVPRDKAADSNSKQGQHVSDSQTASRSAQNRGAGSDKNRSSQLKSTTNVPPTELSDDTKDKTIASAKSSTNAEKLLVQNLVNGARPGNQSRSKDRQDSKTVNPQSQHIKPSAHGAGSRRPTMSSVRSTAAATAGPGPKKKGQTGAALAHLMFDVNRGPAWDPHQKVPKMEGIDTVVIKTKDGKGQVVKQKKQVKSVVKDAKKLLSTPTEGPTEKRPASKRSLKMASPDVTLGSDFDVDDDEDETVGDIFERLRKKYNIQIDSDEELDP